MERALRADAEAAAPPASCAGLLPEALRGRRERGQLWRDVAALTAIRHPCVAALMGVADLPGRGLCLVMELAEFGSLWDLLHNPTFPLRAEAALRMLHDVAQGMRFLHAAAPPVLHGDLRSGNVLVDRSLGARLSDFGLAGPRADPHWLAPERLARAGGMSAAADAWSFGVLVYEVLTRRCPYEGEDLPAALAAVARGAHRPPTPPGCSPPVAAIMADCLLLDPRQRPPFAELDRRLTTLDASQMTSPAFAPEPGGGGDRASGSLMLERLPRHVAEALRAGEKVPPEAKPMVSVMFSDVAGFTALSAAMPAEKVSGMLDRLFDRLDRAAEQLGVYKVETIGDAYICATNVVCDQAGCHAAVLARFAVAAVRAAAETLVDEDDPGRGCVRFRVGLHSGPCTACVMGRTSPKYTLLGDTVNTASRMESTSVPGRAQCSARTAELIREQDPTLRLRARGGVEVKGKGIMDTFWILTESAADETPAELAAAHSASSVDPHVGGGWIDMDGTAVKAEAASPSL
jgi:class 3 adenylate cyclase